MSQTIGDAVGQLAIDYWIEKHNYGRKSYQFMRYLGDNISSVC